MINGFKAKGQGVASEAPLERKYSRCAQLFLKRFQRLRMNQSKDFKIFLHDYFTGPSIIRGRGEEDSSIWRRLKGDELEKAKQMILDVLPSNQECYMRAANILRDNRAIEKLKLTADTADDIHASAYAAKILFDWIGYEDYEKKLDEVFRSKNQWAKTSLDYWIAGLNEDLALKYFWMAMNDKDDFVRYCSYEALERYYGVWKLKNSGREIKYYTDEEVYQDKELFTFRQAQLKEKIELWREEKNNYAQQYILCI